MFLKTLKKKIDRVYWFLGRRNILKKKVKARTNGRGCSHGIMRCIYAKAQIALKRPYNSILQVL